MCTDRYDFLLERAIISCLNQTHEKFELLIVANGPEPEDLFLKIKAAYSQEPKIRFFFTHTRDLNFSLDLGIHYANGNYLARMDADDVMHPDRLSIQHKFLIDNPNVGVVGSFYNLIDLDSNVIGSVCLPITNAKIRKRMYYRSPFCHPSVMFKTDLVRKIGGYRGGKSAEDYDLWSRLSLDPLVLFHNIPEFLLHYNRDPGRGSRRSKIAYANVASSQLRNFLLTWNARWLIGALFTCVKLIAKSNKD